MKACDIPDECIEDPRFIKVLGASLCSEIAESKVILTETNVEIESFKDELSRNWTKRKVLKQSVNELRQKQQVFTIALESLTREVKHRTNEIATAKNRLDDASLRGIEERSKFMKILDNYRDTWQKYKVEYERYPLAIERQRSCVNVKQLEVLRRVAEYRKNEFLKMLKQRKEIDVMRIKVSLVDLSRMMLRRWNYEKQLDLLKKLANEIDDELTDYNRQLTEVQRAVERKKLSELEETVKMPPPRLDFRFMRNHQQNLQAGRSMSSKSREAWIGRDESDTTSINTLMLEEMCEDDVIDRVEERSGKNIPNKWTNDLKDKNSSCSNFSTPRSGERASRIDSTNSADVVRHKLQRLDIEKQSNRKRPSSMSMPIDDFCKDNNAKIGVNDDAVEIISDLSHQRTRRWCEETSLAHRNMTSGYIPPEIPQERDLQKSPSPNVESAMEQNVTARINDDDESQLDCRSSLNFSPIQRVTNISVENQENHHTDRISTPPLRSNNVADSAVVVNEGNACTSVSKDVDFSKDAMNDEDTNIQNYADVPPKKRKLSRINYSPLMTPQRDTGEKSVEPSIITNLNGSIDNSSFHEHISNGRRFVPSSYMSSDDLQQITSQGTFGLNQFKVGAGRCPSFSNWENWSPSKQMSMASFSPSSMTDKRDENNVTPMINRKDEQKPDESSEPTTNFAHGFFKKTSNNLRKMF